MLAAQSRLHGAVERSMEAWAAPDAMAERTAHATVMES
jgi:hypothetical protein